MATDLKVGVRGDIRHVDKPGLGQISRVVCLEGNFRRRCGCQETGMQAGAKAGLGAIEADALGGAGSCSHSSANWFVAWH